MNGFLEEIIKSRNEAIETVLKELDKKDVTIERLAKDIYYYGCTDEMFCYDYCNEKIAPIKKCDNKKCIKKIIEHYENMRKVEDK